MDSGATAQKVGSGAAVLGGASTAVVGGVVVLVPAVVGMTSSRGWGIAGLVLLGLVVAGAVVGAVLRPATGSAPEPSAGPGSPDRQPGAGSEAAVRTRWAGAVPRLFGLVAVSGLGLLIWGLVLIGRRLQDSWTDPVDALPVVAGLCLLFGGVLPTARGADADPEPEPAPSPVQRALLGLPPADRDPDGQPDPGDQPDPDGQPDGDPDRHCDRDPDHDPDAGTVPAASPPQPPQPQPAGRSRDAVLGALLGLVLVAAVTAGGLVFVPGLAVDAATADPGPAPAWVTRIGSISPTEVWSHRIDGVQNVMAGVRGPLIDVGDGVVALEGRTGASLWHFRVPRQRVRVAASRDGRTVVAFTAGDDRPRSRSQRMVVLDAGTGRVRLDREVPEGHGERWTTGVEVDQIIVTRTAVVTRTMGYQVARSLTDGRLLWRTDRYVDDCTPHEARLAADVLVDAYTCPGYNSAGEEAWVTGTDPASGRSLWRHTLTAESFRPPFVLVANSGDALAVTLVATVMTSTTTGGRHDWAVSPAASAVWILDPATGAILHRADPATVSELRPLDRGRWLAAPWPRGWAGTTPTGRYTLGPLQAPGGTPLRSLSAQEGACLEGAVITLEDGWVCQPAPANLPTGYQVVAEDPAAAVPLPARDKVWLTSVPGALVSWTPGTPYQVTGLRW